VPPTTDTVGTKVLNNQNPILTPDAMTTTKTTVFTINLMWYKFTDLFTYFLLHCKFSSNTRRLKCKDYLQWIDRKITRFHCTSRKLTHRDLSVLPSPY